MSRSAGGKMSASKLSEALGGGALMKLDSMQSRAGSRVDNAWHIGVVSIELKELNKVSPCAPRSLLNNAALTGVSDHTREAIDKVEANGTEPLAALQRRCASLFLDVLWSTQQNMNPLPEGEGARSTSTRVLCKGIKFKSEESS
ncbi:hypothetical protein FFLO_00077 [Filobasidium floriforme]|uniref:Uncharacterized protein n=1 Tax=Filobasidium floriforme TaxID=5210 RepID=A0A8K0NR94_9TREE|nr:hypothetical protein FFLO_00077 [Filobasidium floriforme]